MKSVFAEVSFRKNPRGFPFLFLTQSDQQVFGSDVVLVKNDGFLSGEFKAALGVGGIGCFFEVLAFAGGNAVQALPK